VTGDSSVQLGGPLAGLVPGSRVAGYLLERQVGTGGTAAVFRARDERLGRVVALKLLAADLTKDEAFRRRFLREARAVAAVDHPHIIPVYEAGEADGVLFIAMRFVAGSDLRAVIGREGGLPPERAAAFFSPVASALDAAHASGLVHRDVKPANILVDAGPGRPEHVYLSDFGLARGMLSSSGLTRAGQFLGTPDYAAPEQISGATVDGRADQYALACVAYTLLAAQVLFERDQAMATLYAHLFKPPPRVTKLRPDLPAAVDEVLARALAKEPRARYDSCGAFSDALRQALGLGPYGSAWPGRPSARPGDLPPASSSAMPPSAGPIALETTIGAGGVPASAAAMISTASLTAPPDSSAPAPQAPSTAPQASPSPVPEAAPSTAPQASPSPVPEAAPSTAPQTRPSLVPDAAPSTAPQTRPSLVPDAASRPAPPGSSVPPVAAGAWTAVVTADRGYYDSVQAEGTPDAASISFPEHCPPRRFRLSGTEARIGRRSASRHIEPEIDLKGPPTDPGVSREHAKLIAGPDRSWSVVDLGSTSGTLVNGSEITPGEAVPLRDGDRINLGAWTMITMTRT
jgi:serine/threonine protein kinase